MNWRIGWGIAGLVSGISLGTFFDFGFSLAGLFLLIAGGLAAIAWRKKLNYWPAIFLCLGLAFGLGRIYSTPTADLSWAQQVGKLVQFEALVVAEPDRRDNSTLLTLRLENSGNKILAILPAYADYNYGDQVKVKGKLAWPENFETENGRLFNYQKYLEKEGIFFVVQRPEIELLASQKGNWLVSRLFQIKTSLVQKLEQLIPEPESSLLTGLVVGEKQALGKEWNDRFRAAGLSHIVVLSGYNLSIVAENVLRIFNLFLPARAGLAAGAGSIIIFALMVGGGATVLRASLMALIALLARLTGRVYQATIALVAAGVLMVLWNPLLLIYDLGFQLSFLATLGVIHGPIILAPFFSKLTDRWGLKEILLTTLSAQLMVLPLILYQTGNLSLWALPANLLVLPIIPLTMLSGFLSGLVGFIGQIIAWPLAFLTHLLLTYILIIVKIFASLPGANLVIAQFPLALTILAYLLIFWFFRKSLLKQTTLKFPGQ